jgi:hypothetical protein
MKTLFFCCLLLIGTACLAQDEDSTSSMTFSYTLKDGTQTTVEDGDEFTVVFTSNSASIYHKPKGEKKDRDYDANKLTEVRAVSEEGEIVYYPYACAGEVLKTLLTTVYETPSVTLYQSFPLYDENTHQYKGHYYYVSIKGAKPRFSSIRFTTFSRYFTCKELTRLYKDKEGNMTIADRIEIIDNYEKLCGN